MINTKKGFTLLELLIVIAILAVLATAVVLVLNPAEYLRQARDTQRTNDLNAIKNALNLYLTSATNPSMITVARCTANTGGTNATQTAFENNLCQSSATGSSTSGIATSTAVDGTGWVNVKLNDLVGGSPLAKLPVDPSNADNTFFYQFASDASSLKYRLAGKLESQKYQSLMTSDGGPNNNFFEVGTDMTTTANPF